MHAIKVHAISPELAELARMTSRSPQYGHPAHREVATGTGPCRLCLATFAIGADERLLFTYNPFEGLDNVPLPGPVFVHADGCAPHEGIGFPEQLSAIPLIAEAYRAGRECTARVPLDGTEREQAVAALLEDDTVQYLHLRHATAGCYIARVERADSRSS